MGLLTGNSLNQSEVSQNGLVQTTSTAFMLIVASTL